MAEVVVPEVEVERVGGAEVIARVADDRGGVDIVGGERRIAEVGRDGAAHAPPAGRGLPVKAPLAVNVLNVCAGVELRREGDSVNGRRRDP